MIPDQGPYGTRRPRRYAPSVSGGYGYNTGGPLVMGGGMPGAQPVPQPHHMAGPPPIVMQGGQPTLGAYQQPQSVAAGQQLDPAAQAQLHARALAYARARLMQMRKVMSVLPPELQAMLGQQQGMDPDAAWRQISGAFAQQSRKAGYQDPRYYLRYVLPEIMRSQQANAANPHQGGV